MYQQVARDEKRRRRPGRPPDPERRTATLSRATEYVLEHGLADLSLRPLAAALGTSTRMLLYDFGSKEQLVAAVLADARRREAALLAEQRRKPGTTESETLHWIWSWLTRPERAPFLRLFFEVYADAMAHPEKYAGGARPMVDDWLDFLRTRWSASGLDDATATLMIGAVRGLLLDRLTASDPERVDQALARFAQFFDDASREICQESVEKTAQTS